MIDDVMYIVSIILMGVGIGITIGNFELGVSITLIGIVIHLIHMTKN